MPLIWRKHGSWILWVTHLLRAPHQQRSHTARTRPAAAPRWPAPPVYGWWTGGRYFESHLRTPEGDVCSFCIIQCNCSQVGAAVLAAPDHAFKAHLLDNGLQPPLRAHQCDGGNDFGVEYSKGPVLQANENAKIHSRAWTTTCRGRPKNQHAVPAKGRTGVSGPGAPWVEPQWPAQTAGPVGGEWLQQPATLPPGSSESVQTAADSTMMCMSMWMNLSIVFFFVVVVPDPWNLPWASTPGLCGRWQCVPGASRPATQWLHGWTASRHTVRRLLCTAHGF